MIITDTITAWESRYYSELVRRASYDFDSQRLRPYLAFDRVKSGLLDITSRLFGVGLDFGLSSRSNLRFDLSHRYAPNLEDNQASLQYAFGF